MRKTFQITATVLALTVGSAFAAEITSPSHLGGAIQALKSARDEINIATDVGSNHKAKTLQHIDAALAELREVQVNQSKKNKVSGQPAT